MDLRQLRYFIALATQQHYGRAADVLHIAQPALSRQIKLLEEELGVTLFHRHSRGAAPTEDGLALLERASSLVAAAEQLKRDMSARRLEPQGTVSVGLSPGLSVLLAGPLLEALVREQSRTTLRLVEGFSPGLHRQVIQGEIDLAVLNGPVRAAGLAVLPLLPEQMCLIGPREHPAMQGGGEIAIEALDGVPLVMTGLVKSGVRLELEAAAARCGVQLDRVAEVETFQSARQIVRRGLALTVHFAAGIRVESDEDRLAAVPIEGLHVRRVLARASDRPGSRAVDSFATLFQGVVGSMVGSGEWVGAALDE